MEFKLEHVEAKTNERGFSTDLSLFRLMRPESRTSYRQRLLLRKTVAIRELLQKFGRRLQTRFLIRDLSTSFIRTYKEGDELVVEDNGVEWTSKKPYEFLAKKGFSYLSIRRFREAPVPMLASDPISKWGLGILSCF